MQARTPALRFLSDNQADAFVEDHLQAVAVVEALNSAIDADAARKALVGAAAFLVPHMAEEEALDGVFHWLTALAPRLCDEIELLRAEHLAIRAALHAAVAATDADVAELAHALARRLESHETAERAAIEAAIG
jgi:hypothetical protein